MAVSTFLLRTVAVLGVLFCLHTSASADLVISFYLQDGDVWMSLEGMGTVPPGAGSTGASLDFLDFSGTPFLNVSDSPYDVSGGSLNLNYGNTNYQVTELNLVNEGTGLSDLYLTVPGANLTPNDMYTFSGAARVVGLELNQLALGTYLAQGGDQDTFISVQLVSTPEPTSLALMGVGALGLFVTGRRRRKPRPAPVPDAPAPSV